MATEQSFTIMQFDRRGGAAFIDGGQVQAEEALRSKALCWVHLDYSEPSVVTWLQKIDWLHPIIKTNLIDDDTRPRSFSFQDGLFLSLRGVNLNPGAVPEDMIAVRLWANEHCIITSNRRRLLSIEDIRNVLGQGIGPCSSNDFVQLLIERLALRAETIIEQIEDEFDVLEDDLAASDGSTHRAILSQIRRQAIRLRRFFSPQRLALEHMINDSPGWFTDTDKVHIRESLNKFNRFVEELDSIKDRAIVAQEEQLSKLSEILNQRMYTLSLVAAVFLPLGFLTGLLGINVGGIPGADSPYGFLAICLGIAAIITSIVAYLKVKKWF